MNPNDLFAAEIAQYRRDFINDAARAAVDADRHPDEVARIVYLAGLRWDDTHPTLARRAEAA